MITLTNDDIQLLKERFPFLIPRNVFTGDVVEGSKNHYIGDDLPCGWSRLFLLYCKTISYIMTWQQAQELRFTDVKEKYGTLRISHLGAPEIVNSITYMYEAYSKNICSKCGKYSSRVTDGWITYLCSNCAKELEHVKTKKHKRLRKLKLTTYINNEKGTLTYNLKGINKLYKKVQKMSDADFLYFLTCVY